ncbi:hypothetical protein [Candidatus Methanocrinis natronophilus]|uniref:Type II toxin-antitoxin system VapC family toxin n=1 Tax=Candidatus Methanocrinis natronophilus TaxID=3033396 RepID=A0ABT5X625_9EURY|nr:hypothetical protein [Candidatus Methanocrinis natronophilus]MDF0590149.1 hypothetical protein [Candidatus Methanocrinis natronophilus]
MMAVLDTSFIVDLLWGAKGCRPPRHEADHRSGAASECVLLGGS